MSRYATGSTTMVRDSDAVEPSEKLGIVRIKRAHASVHDGLNLDCGGALNFRLRGLIGGGALDGASGLNGGGALNGRNGLNGLNDGGALHFLHDP